MKNIFFAILATQMFVTVANAEICTLSVKQKNDKGVEVVMEQVPFQSMPSGADTLVLQAVTSNKVKVRIILDGDELITTFEDAANPGTFSSKRSPVSDIRGANGTAVGVDSKSWEIICPK